MMVINGSIQFLKSNISLTTSVRNMTKMAPPRDGQAIQYLGGPTPSQPRTDRSATSTNANRGLSTSIKLIVVLVALPSSTMKFANGFDLTVTNANALLTIPRAAKSSKCSKPTCHRL